MSRPQKATVDYFPHWAVHGKTLFILEQRYGNDGYAFWFKLLETLCVSENHFLDWNNSVEQEFFLAKSRSTGVSAGEILELLAKLDAIDSELWKIGIIWCQNLVDNVSDAYRKRKLPLPTKDGLFREKLSSFYNITTSCEVSGGRNPEEQEIQEFPAEEIHKGKERKGKEIKGEERGCGGEPPAPPSDPFSPDLLDSEKKQPPEVCLMLSKYLLTKIRNNLPNFKEPNLTKWAEVFDLTIRRDGRSVDDLMALIDFATQDDFWKTNILSPDKLRKHFDRLTLQMSKGNSKRDPTRGYAQPSAPEEFLGGVVKL